VPAGAVLEHTERWSLHKNVHLGSISDAEIDRAVRPLVGN
jgi:3-methyladenine DNA glycosylase AlkC